MNRVIVMLALLALVIVAVCTWLIWPEEESTVMSTNNLIQLLANSKYTARKQAIDDLVKRGKSVVPKLLQVANDKNQSVRARSSIFDILGRIGDEAAIPALTQGARDQHESLRWTAIRSLGRIDGAGEAAQVLLQIYRTDEDTLNRYYASQALANMTNKSAVPVLLQALEDRNPIKDADGNVSWVGSVAAKALSNIGDKSAVPYLLRVSEDINRHPALRTSALEALGDIGDQSLLSPLERISENDRVEGVRKIAKQSIERIRERTKKSSSL